MLEIECYISKYGEPKKLKRDDLVRLCEYANNEINLIDINFLDNFFERKSNLEISIEKSSKNNVDENYLLLEGINEFQQICINMEDGLYKIYLKHLEENIFPRKDEFSRCMEMIFMRSEMSSKNKEKIKIKI